MFARMIGLNLLEPEILLPFVGVAWPVPPLVFLIWVIARAVVLRISASR